jgi:hypothetical protein
MAFQTSYQQATRAALVGLAKKGVAVFGPGPRGVTIVSSFGVRRLTILGFDGPYVRLAERKWVD